MYLTWLDSNSWLIEIANKRVLLDPWLVGSLTFGNTPWFFKADRRSPLPIPELIPKNLDLILLSQGLPDHSHPPTLKALKLLSSSIPVVGSPSAAKLAQELGYTDVTALAHDLVFRIPDLLEIHAFKGSPTGPTTIENGYILKDLIEGTSLYYEPHGYHSPAIQAFAPVDVVITPILNLSLPLFGAIIQGQKGALQVAKWLKPRIILPTAGAGDLISSGFLLNFLKAEGSVDILRSQFQDHNINTQILEVKVGERLQVEKPKHPFAAPAYPPTPSGDQVMPFKRDGTSPERPTKK